MYRRLQALVFKEATLPKWSLMQASGLLQGLLRSVWYPVNNRSEGKSLAEVELEGAQKNSSG